MRSTHYFTGPAERRAPSGKLIPDLRPMQGRRPEYRSAVRDGTHVAKRCSFGAQLLALAVIAAAADLHCEAEVADAARPVGTHQDVPTVDVSMGHGWFHHTCPTKDSACVVLEANTVHSQPAHFDRRGTSSNTVHGRLKYVHCLLKNDLSEMAEEVDCLPG